MVIAACLTAACLTAASWPWPAAAAAIALAQPDTGSAPAPNVSLVFAGDIVLDGAPGQAIARGADPFAAVADLLRADIRIGNLECVVATSGKPAAKIYTFRAHPRVLPVVARHFDAVALANNHTGDFGPVALHEMLGRLDRAGIGRFGAGNNLQQAHTPLVFERAGLRIALLGYNEFMPRSFEAGPYAPGVAWSEDEQVADDLRTARAIHRADIVLAVMHWGWENDPHSTARQRQLAHWMIDHGADAVIGGHPHVTQEAEVYRGRPIVYSVGNFVMDSLDNEPQTRGWVLRLALDRDGVQALRTDPVRINRRGVPHPAPTNPSPCWRRGDAQPGVCGPPARQRVGVD